MSQVIPSSKSFDYSYTSIDHYLRSIALRDNNHKFEFMVYSALELRFCIERLAFEYLALLTYKKRELSKTEKKLYQPGDIFERVLREEPFLAKHVDFLNAIFEANNRQERMISPDVQWLNESYG